MQSPNRIPPRTHQERQPLRLDRDVEVESHRVRKLFEIFVESLISYIRISTPGTLWSPLLNVATTSQTSSSPMITEVSDDTSSSSISIIPQSQISSLKTQKDAVRLYAVAMYGMIRLSTECVQEIMSVLTKFLPKGEGRPWDTLTPLQRLTMTVMRTILLQLPQESKKAEEKVFNVRGISSNFFLRISLLFTLTSFENFVIISLEHTTPYIDTDTLEHTGTV